MKYSKQLSLVFLLLLAITSCKESSQNIKANSNKIEDTQVSKSAEVKSIANTTYLCKVNGINWEYTEASGIVSTHKKTGKRTAILTFKKKLERGSEIIQLYYDGNSFELEKGSIHLKFPKKGGGMLTGIYELSSELKARNPNSEMRGKLDLSDSKGASGNAELLKFNIRFDKNLLENQVNAIVSATGINFGGIGYSDLDKLSYGN